MTSPRLTLEDGAPITLVALDGERFTLVAPRAAAPGTPLGVSLDGAHIVFKVARSSRREDGTFTIEGRVVNLTRPLRTRLLALL